LGVQSGDLPLIIIASTVPGAQGRRAEQQQARSNANDAAGPMSAGLAATSGFAAIRAVPSTRGKPYFTRHDEGPAPSLSWAGMERPVVEAGDDRLALDQ